MAMENEFEYYVMNSKGDDTYPLLKVVGRKYTEEGLESLLYLEFNDPVPQNPVMADFLSGPYDFVSGRIADVMKSFDMEGVEFIPGELTDHKGRTIKDYYCINVECNTYEAMDKVKSDYEYDEDVDCYWVNKIVLDKEVLKQIPSNRRLGFRLEEKPGYFLYHKSIVDAIITANPTGVVFRNIEDFEF